MSSGQPLTDLKTYWINVSGTNGTRKKKCKRSSKHKTFTNPTYINRVKCVTDTLNSIAKNNTPRFHLLDTKQYKIGRERILPLTAAQRAAADAALAAAANNLDDKEEEEEEEENNNAPAASPVAKDGQEEEEENNNASPPAPPPAAAPIRLSRAPTAKSAAAAAAALAKFKLENPPKKINEIFIGDTIKTVNDLIKDKFHFLFIKSPKNTIEEIERSFREIMEVDKKIFGVIIDPYIKMSRSKFAPDRDDLYGAYIMNILGDLCRKEKVNGFIIMHQQTPSKDNTGLYPKPDKYNIKSGGTFADTADNVLSIWRPSYATDKINPRVIFSSLKIKKQKLVGIPDDFEMSFDRITNRYCYKATDVPLYNWNKWKFKSKVQRAF